MKKSCLIVLFIVLVSICRGQECLLVKDTFCLVTLDIRGNGVNPIVMNGVTTKSVLKQLKRGNIVSLLISFYRNAYYVPDIYNGPKRMISYCMKDSSGNIYLKAHQVELALLAGRIKGNSRSMKFKLKSSEMVFLSVTRIGGSFWKVNKSHPGINKSSNEEDISKIEQIEDCYVPFEIDYIKKPNKLK